MRGVDRFLDPSRVQDRAGFVRAAQVWRVDRYPIGTRLATGRGAVEDLAVDDRPESELRHGGLGPQTVRVGSLRVDPISGVGIDQGQ